MLRSKQSFFATVGQGDDFIPQNGESEVSLRSLLSAGGRLIVFDHVLERTKVNEGGYLGRPQSNLAGWIVAR
jgi:hypothetical protein